MRALCLILTTTCLLLVFPRGGHAACFASFAQAVKTYLDDYPNESILSSHLARIQMASVQTEMSQSVIRELDGTVLGRFHYTQGELQALYRLYEEYYSRLEADGVTDQGDSDLTSYMLMKYVDRAISGRSSHVPSVAVPALSLPTTFYANNTPAAVRLALVPNGMTVSWQSLLNYSVPPTIIYGTADNGSLPFTATGRTHTYGTVFFSDVVLPALAPATRYAFRIVADPAIPVHMQDPLAPLYTFTSAPQTGSEENFTVTVVGDMGAVNANATHNAVLSLVDGTAFVLHIGDISYADDWLMRLKLPGERTYEDSWNSWQVWQEPIMSRVAYMTLPGNHEATCQEVVGHKGCPASQNNFTAYRHRFRMPSLESGAGAVMNMWSSFDYGLAHFVLLDTETDYPSAPDGPGTKLNGGPFGGAGTGNPALLDWLERDLAKANASRATVPWVVVSGHRPLYSSGGSDADDAVRGAFEDLMLRYRVDLYLAGHVHNYERLYPINKGTAQQFNGTTYMDPSAPTYIINGCAGNDEGHKGAKINPQISASLDITNYGFGRLTVANRTHLHWEFVRSADLSVGDELWIVQTRS